MAFPLGPESEVRSAFAEHPLPNFGFEGRQDFLIPVSLRSEVLLKVSRTYEKNF